MFVIIGQASFGPLLEIGCRCTAGPDANSKLPIGRR